MFIEDGETKYINPTANRITLAMTNPAGTITVNQRDGASGWFGAVCGGDPIVLDSNNTMRSFYAPCKLQVVASGSGAYLYNHGNKG